MSVRAALPVCLTTIALLGACSLASAGPWNPGRGEFSSEVRGSLFATDDFLNENGDRNSLDGRFEQRAVQWRSEIGWKKTTAFLLTLPLESVTVRSADNSFSRNNTGLSDIRVGFRRAIFVGATALAVEADWQAPLGYNRHLFPGLGDGLQRLGAAVHFGGPVAGRGFYQLSGGGDRRFLSLTNKSGSTAEGVETWANEATATADLALWLTRSVLVGGRYEGSFTLSHGDRLEDSDQQLVGPIVVYRVDDHLDVVGGSWHTATGQNVLHVNQYYVAVSFKNTRLNRLQGFLGGTSPGR
jgi:hypothetical protein